MYDYLGQHELKAFYTIPEVCELLELDMDKLRYRCILHGILPIRMDDGTLGLNWYMFQRLNNALYEQQCRDGLYDGNPWSDTNFADSNCQKGKGTMLDYLRPQHPEMFFTIQDVCEFLGLTKDELRFKCEQYGVEVHKRSFDGKWGFWGEDFSRFNNTLYYEQCRDGSDDSRIFMDASTNNVKSFETSRRINSMLSYIKNIKDLESVYTFDDACTLLGVTYEELEKICNENGIPTYQNGDETRIITCYEYLTLNNKIYRKQCEALGKSDPA